MMAVFLDTRHGVQDGAKLFFHKSRLLVNFEEGWATADLFCLHARN